MRPFLTERQKDRVATVLIRTGGLLVILVVVGIVLNIGVEALPLFGSAKQGPVERLGAAHRPLLVGSDPRREAVWVLEHGGRLTFPESDIEDLVLTTDGGPALVAADHEIHGLISVIAEDGTAVVGRVRFSDTWADETRTTSARWRESADPLELGEGQWVGVTANGDDDGNLVLAAWDRSGRLELRRWDSDDEAWEESAAGERILDVASVAIAEGLSSMAVIDTAGTLRVLRLPSLETAGVVGVEEPTAAVRFLIGGGTLVVAGRDGSVGVLLDVPRVSIHNTGEAKIRVAGATLGPGEAAVLPDDEIGRRFATRPEVVLKSAASRWQRVRELDELSGLPTVIAPSHRRRGFLIGTESGEIGTFLLDLRSTSPHGHVVAAASDRAGSRSQGGRRGGCARRRRLQTMD